MIIGLKYCGGCNPAYNRSAAVAGLKKSLEEKDISFEAWREDAVYDYCLLIMGCKRECIDTGKLTNCKKLIRLSSADDFAITQKQLWEMV